MVWVEILADAGHGEDRSPHVEYGNRPQIGAERDISCTVNNMHKPFQANSSEPRINLYAVPSYVGNHGLQATVSALYARPARVSIALDWAQ